ncbi:hypothetical protein DPMN_000530 [Dreissena polymorpha]|uniref:Uncharacterized protein n=1 Tax=Dreissena polymorpha TaxID=45954 RepID=A0A9D4MFJ0_DREPO|nr:hypothetical protein DPMN_000530 [Dreissena polymorpha]
MRKIDTKRPSIKAVVVTVVGASEEGCSTHPRPRRSPDAQANRERLSGHASVHTKNDNEEDERDNFYNILSTIIHDRPKRKTIIFICDFNARIGSTMWLSKLNT